MSREWTGGTYTQPGDPLRYDKRIQALAETWPDPATYRPLRITLITDTAVGGYDPLHLDSLLTRGIINLVVGGRGLMRSEQAYWLPLPLRCLWRHPQTRLPLWASTDFAPVGVQAKGIAPWHRYQPPSRLMASPKGRPYAPRAGTGPEKVMDIPLPVVAAEGWQADCVGDAEAIQPLLAALGSHVGKKRSQGWGAVREWRVEPLDRFTLRDEEGRLRRPIPINALWSDRVPLDAVLAGWTPPYWPGVVGTQAICVAPGSVADVPADWEMEYD